jgi:hypothetical protein
MASGRVPSTLTTRTGQAPAQAAADQGLGAAATGVPQHLPRRLSDLELNGIRLEPILGRGFIALKDGVWNCANWRLECSPNNVVRIGYRQGCFGQL